MRGNGSFLLLVAAGVAATVIGQMIVRRLAAPESSRTDPLIF